MNPYIVFSALAVGGFYLLNVPLVAALAVGAGGIGWSLGAFAPAGALRRAERSAAGLGKTPRKRARSHPPLRTLPAPAKHLLRHTRLLLVRVSGVLSTKDAMRTALAVGALNTLAAIPHSRVISRVHPDFSGAPARVEIEAAVAIPLGQALTATVLWARELLKMKTNQAQKTLKERMKAWKSSLSKT